MNPMRVLIVLIGLPGLTLAQDCTDIEDDAERLTCYDANKEASSTIPKVLAAPVEQQVPLAPVEQQVPLAPVEQQVPPAPAEASVGDPDDRDGTTIAATAPDEFGSTEPFDAAREYIEASIVEIATGGNIDYLRLDNGQVWREVEESHMRFKEGRKVTITEGIMGSYDLRMEGLKNVVKVRRVR